MQYLGYVATKNYLLFTRNSNLSDYPVCFIFFLINLTTLEDGKQVNVSNPNWMTTTFISWMMEKQ